MDETLEEPVFDTLDDPVALLDALCEPVLDEELDPELLDFPSWPPSSGALTSRRASSW